MTDAERLKTIRRRVVALDPDETWTLGADGTESTQLYARDGAGGMVAIAGFSALATMDEMQLAAGAPDDFRFLLGLVNRAYDRVRQLERALAETTGGGAEDRQRKDFAAEAAMKCAEPAFKRFLMEKHGFESPATDERAAQKLRSLCGVTSRRELNAGGQAEAAWKALRGEFDAWRRDS